MLGLMTSTEDYHAVGWKAGLSWLILANGKPIRQNPTKQEGDISIQQLARDRPKSSMLRLDGCHRIHSRLSC